MSPDIPRTERQPSEQTRRGEASGQHQPLRRDDDDQRARQRLSEVGLDDQGEAFEDEQRDRHSSGSAPSRDAASRPAE